MMTPRFAISFAVAVVMTAPAAVGAEPVGTAFSYQGKLTQGDAHVPVDDTVVLRFTLWDDPLDDDPAHQMGPTLTFDGQGDNPPPVEVDDGLFTVYLDFGADVFTSEARWLQLALLPPDAGGEDFVELEPRQRLAPAPYAMSSLSVVAPLTLSGEEPTGHIIKGINTAEVGWALWGEHSTSGNYGFLGNDVYGGYGQSGAPGSPPVFPAAGLFGRHTGGGHGVLGRSATGTAVYGTNDETEHIGYLASEYYGAYGQSSVGFVPPKTVGAGVYGENTGEGHGVHGVSAAGSGVRGSNSTSGNFGSLGTEDYGVYAESESGYAGFFEGDLKVNGEGRGIEFPDGTVQTTASGSGSGSLWQAAGDDLYYTDGNVGIGVDTPDTQLEVAGTTRTGILEITAGGDLSEGFDIRGLSASTPPAPGMVVSIDPSRPGELKVSGEAYDRKVAGIISGAGGIRPGLLMGQEGSRANGATPVALTGRVYCRVDASYAAVHPGDLLTTSPTPGHAMRVADYSKAQGAIIGKAMTPLEEGRGLVLVLVNLQ